MRVRGEGSFEGSLLARLWMRYLSLLCTGLCSCVGFELGAAEIPLHAVMTSLYSSLSLGSSNSDVREAWASMSFIDLRALSNCFVLGTRHCISRCTLCMDASIVRYYFFTA